MMMIDGEDDQSPATVLNTVSNISQQDIIKFLHKNLHACKRLLIFHQQTSINLLTAAAKRQLAGTVRLDKRRTGQRRCLRAELSPSQYFFLNSQAF